MRLVAIVGILLAVAGCSGIEVQSDFDPQADFGKLHTYAWREPDPRATDTISRFTLDRIRESVRAELAARGYSAAASTATADFVVTYRAAVRRRISAEPEARSFTVGYAWTPGFWRAETGSGSRTYHEGTLVIEMLQRERLLWVGKAEAAIDEDSTPAERQERAGEAVGRVMEGFPGGRNR